MQAGFHLEEKWKMNFAFEINRLSEVCGNCRRWHVHRIAVVGKERCDRDNEKRFGLQIFAHCGSPEVVFSDGARC